MQLLRMDRAKIRHLFRRIRFQLSSRSTRMVLIMVLLFIVWVIYMFYQIFSLSPHDNHDQFDAQLERLTSANKCSPMSESAQAAFRIFVQRVINTFEMLQVTHFLCYESLWTALRRSNLVEPGNHKHLHTLRISDACFNLCIVGEDLDKHDHQLVETRFRNNGIAMSYVRSDGVYVLKPTTQIGSSLEMHPDLFAIHARVHVFVRDQFEDQYRRSGWKSSLLPSSLCRQLHCFPPSLIERKPLPKIDFVSSLSVNVPHEGIEIQKYHYPDTWWTLANSFEDSCS